MDSEFVLGWLGLFVLGGVGYVLYRVLSARDRGEDAGAAGRRAVGDVLPVIGAGLAGLLIFFALMSVMLIFLFFAFLTSFTDQDGGWVSGIIVLLLLGVLALVGLPVLALVAVIRRRRRRLDR